MPFFSMMSDPKLLILQPSRHLLVGIRSDEHAMALCLMVEGYIWKETDDWEELKSDGK